MIARLATTLSSLLVSFLLVSASAKAGNYDALCGGFECRVTVTPEKIISPFGVIPPRRVTSWSGAGESSTSVGTGFATTILLGPVGIAGFFVKDHDFDFLVSGYNDKGRKSYLQIQFKNNKPAKKFALEMFQVTGLGMGETRTAEEIRSHEAGHLQENLYGEKLDPSTSIPKEDGNRKELEMTRFKR